MRRVLIGVVVLASWLGSDRPAVAKQYEALVVHVDDGDSIVVRTRQGGTSRVRLLGIDAPEIAHGDAPGQEPWGTRAHRHLQQRLQGQRVRLETQARERDRYGRLLAYVYVDDRCINEEMVVRGLAVAYVGEDRSEIGRRIALAERTARARAIGIWQHRGGLKEMPGDYRRRYREGDWLKPFAP